MGFAANQARLMGLISRQRDLELESHFITQHRLFLSNAVSTFFNMRAKLEPGSKAAQILDARIKSLQQADKTLEMHLNRISSQSKAIEREIGSVRKLISKNIQSSFGLMGS